MRKVEFSDEELQVLAALLDSGVRHDGLKCVHNASVLLKKIENAEEIIDEDTEPDINPDS